MRVEAGDFAPETLVLSVELFSVADTRFLALLESRLRLVLPCSQYLEIDGESGGPLRLASLV